MRKLTVKEIAEHFKVEKRVAQNWVKNGLFPNAKLEEVPIFGAVWQVPESDLKGFKQPHPGRPKNSTKEKKAA